MITCLVGDNSFEIERALDDILGDFDGTPEKINVQGLEISKLPDLLMGVSLFEPKRLVVIRELSSNKSVWSVFGDFISKVDPDIHVVLIEPNIDKRTVAYKQIKKHGQIKEFKLWGDRDYQLVEKWVSGEAARLGLVLDKQCLVELINRVGFDQWQLSHALEKLSLVGNVSINAVRDIIDLNPTENVFNLFDMAVNKNVSGLKKMLFVLEQNEDAYKVSGLLFTQAFQLLTVVESDGRHDVAKDFGIHPFVVSKLEQLARNISKNKIKKIVAILLEADLAMKTTKNEPWMLIDRALMKIANL